MSAIDEMHLRLRGTGLVDGEITFAGLERVARSLQLLARRIGRHLVGQEGVGRSRAAVERATELRLRGLAAGSTVLTIAAGEDDTLMEGLEHLTVDRIAEIFTGMAEDSPPAWTTPLIGEASIALIEALPATSTSCELVSSADRWPAVWLSAGEASRAVWPGASQPPERQPGVAVSGTLDLVDLRTSRFRIRDQLGHHITLDKVRNAADAGRLIGAVVTAVGEATTGSRGQIVSVTGAVVEPTALPTWTMTSLAETVAGSAPPPAGGVDGVDAVEVDEFLALIRE